MLLVNVFLDEPEISWIVLFEFKCSIRLSSCTCQSLLTQIVFIKGERWRVQRWRVQQSAQYLPKFCLIVWMKVWTQAVPSEEQTHRPRGKVRALSERCKRQSVDVHQYETFSLWLLEKRSQHLGADGVYLDDITELEPEVAALYFPKRYSRNQVLHMWSEYTRHVTYQNITSVSVFICLLSDGGSSSAKGDVEVMMGVRSANQSPQSVGSSGVDSGVDSLPEQIGDLPHVAISLCGGLTDNREITAGGLMKEMKRCMCSI